ncbi:cobalamin biosynthesis protein [Kitasatospora sp. NPDC049285]|uniref:cobalamin biosynthesis protein n=1 Tax=Kitasatospora sp. NPDC049285 TaxID=3157096 RepID=UPI003413221D
MAHGTDAKRPAADAMSAVRVVLGVGSRRGADAAEVLRLADDALAALGLDRAAVTLLATLDAKTAEPGLLDAARRLGVPLVGYPAARLAAVPVPTPSATVAGAVGTPSVAEAAALAAAGAGGRLLAPRSASPVATVAVAAAAAGSPNVSESTVNESQEPWS